MPGWLKLAERSALPQVAGDTIARLYLLDLQAAATAGRPFRVARGHYPPHQRLAARRLARLAIADTFSAPGIRLQRDPDGRPRLRTADGGEPGFISISHSGDWVVVALARHPIAVDVEQIEPKRLARSGEPLLRALAERIEHLVPVTPANFFRLWCAHEVAVKLGVDMKSLLHTGGRELAFEQLGLAGGYTAAFAVTRG